MTRTLFVFFFACALALSQISTSQITGTIHDSSGAVVPGAMITATNEATGVTYSQPSTGAGLYAFPALPVGTYTIAVEMRGFKTLRKTGNVLAVGTPLTVDLILEVGQATQTVDVQSTAAAVQSENATVGNVVSRRRFGICR